MWEISQAFRARYRSFLPNSKRLPRQTTSTKLAVFSLNLGILKIEGKKKRPPLKGGLFHWGQRHAKQSPTKANPP
jgi:hypothetical protein